MALFVVYHAIINEMIDYTLVLYGDGLKYDWQFKKNIRTKNFTDTNIDNKVC